MSDDSSRIRVFISSRMTELLDLRAVLKVALERIGLDVFVYEADAGARPESPEAASLAEVERADVVVLVVGTSYGEITEREYEHARLKEKPCLVYSRLSERAIDVDQKRFLDKLSGPRGVPSRASFVNALDLSDRVAIDIRAWLVREYRRLSAAVDDLSITPRRATGFQDDMGRLLAASRTQLSRGNAADLLTWQLRMWFDALGYPLDGEPSHHEHYIEFVVRVPARRRQFISVLVRAKDGEVRAPDVHEAIQLLRREDISECWLIAPLRVSPAARVASQSEPGVEVYSLDELIEDEVDFTRYFEWLDAEARQVRLDDNYVALAATVKEVSAAGKPVGTSRYEDVGVYANLWLKDPASEHISLLGEFGTGKSWFSLKYARDLSLKYREAQKAGEPRPRAPLLVRLRDYARGFKDIGALLTDFVFREHQIDVPGFAALQALNRLGRLVFIFDGFDEMAARVDRQKMADNFWALAAVLGPGSKAILTCRTEYFHFAHQARKLFEGGLRSSAMRDIANGSHFQVAELQMFDRVRLERVLSKKASAAAVEAVMANSNLVDLARRPVMVDLLIEAMPELDTQRVDLAQVYYHAVKRKMERDITQSRTFTSMADKMFFLSELSWEMLSTSQMKLHYKLIPERIRQYFGNRVNDREEDHWHHDLLSQTMLIRDDDGLYQPAHRSLLEFFVAYKLSAEIGALKTEYVGVIEPRARESPLAPMPFRWSTYFAPRSPAAPEMAPLKNFVRDTEDRLAISWGQAKIDSTLADMVYALCGQLRLQGAISPGGEDYGLASAHFVAPILAILQRTCGVGDMNLEGATIRNVTLDGCDLSRQNLARTHWMGGRLRDVQFRGAQLVGSRFSGTTLLSTDMRNADLRECIFDDDATLGTRIMSAGWCLNSGEEVLIVRCSEGRCFAIRPTNARAFEVAPPPLSPSWILEVEGEVALSGLNVTFEARRSPAVGDVPIEPWRQPPLQKGWGVRFVASETANETVSLLAVSVLNSATEEAVAIGRFVDASERSANINQFIAVSQSGRMASLRQAHDNADGVAFITRLSDEIQLEGFAGHVDGGTAFSGGGAFSPSEALIAIREHPTIIGFWAASTGELVGRFRAPLALNGAMVDRASGLPEGELALALGTVDGWAAW